MSRGVFDNSDASATQNLLFALMDTVAEFPKEITECDDSLVKETKKNLRKMIKNKWKNKPEILIEVVRINDI